MSKLYKIDDPRHVANTNGDNYVCRQKNSGEQYKERNTETWLTSPDSKIALDKLGTGHSNVTGAGYRYSLHFDQLINHGDGLDFRGIYQS